MSATKFLLGGDAATMRFRFHAMDKWLEEAENEAYKDDGVLSQKPTCRSVECSLLENDRTACLAEVLPRT